VKLAILGGSFNPVHLGHLFLADAALSCLNYDRVVLVPAYRSPFKLQAEGMENSAGDRLEMLAAAVAGDPRLAIDDCEIRRGGISYTVDTLRDIITRYVPDEKPALIIGDDLASDFPKWHNSGEILEMADIIIGRRVNSCECQYPFPCTFIDNEVINISSHMVRRKITEKKNWRSLVPSAVRAVIEGKKLYGFRGGAEINKGCPLPLVLRVEEAAREALNTERFLHSRNTALLAFDMCRRFGIEAETGYLAGIAHDLGKQIDNKLMLKLAETDGMEISALEKKHPNLLHGRAGAVLLKERFNIHNDDVFEAVAFHTSGRENMGDLAKVIYIADKTEVSRNIDPAFRKMCYEEKELDSIFYAILNKTVNKLKSKNLDLSDETIRLLEKMKGKSSLTI
jgi:nicotinate-nucleotide adenylyltransferase